MKVLNTVTVVHMAPGTYLFEYGMKGEHFYIVLGGQCELLIPNEKKIIKKKELKTLEDEITKLKRQLAAQNMARNFDVTESLHIGKIKNKIKEMNADVEKRKEEMKGMPDMEFFKYYYSGGYFGERALQKPQPRAGSIRTVTDCHFAAINYDAYERLWKKEDMLKES